MMGGLFEVTIVDQFVLGFSILITIAVAIAKNPHEKGTNEYESLRLCRIGVALLVWSFSFGLIGYALALVAFILGIIGIVKGRTGYGLAVIVGSVLLPFISTYATISRLFRS